MLGLLKRGKLTERPRDLLAWADLEVDMEHVLGVGGFGRVHAGRWNSVKVAVKLLAAATLDERDMRKGARAERGGDRRMATRAHAIAALAACPLAWQCTARPTLWGPFRRTRTWCVIMERCWTSCTAGS